MSEGKIKVLKEYLDYHTKDDVYEKLLPATQEALRCIEAMLEENKQLKEGNERLQEQKDFWRKEFVDKKEQLDLYKEVIEEVREYIKDACYYYDLENYSSMTSNEVKELLQILDKVKEN